MAVQPDEPHLWHWLLTHDAQPLIALAASDDAGSPAHMQKLRTLAERLTTMPPQQVCTAVLQLVQARAKAAKKDIPHAGELLVDVEGVEQATSWQVAMYKATSMWQRVMHATGSPRSVTVGFERQSTLWDVCSGIGIDARALMQAGFNVTCIDADAVRSAMAGHNAGCETRIADAATINPAGAWLHIDPARRSEGRRRIALNQLLPPPEVIAPLVTQSSGAAVKLGPGIDIAQVRAAIADGEVEFISEDGRLVQAVLWTGALTQADVRATAIHGGDVLSLEGRPGSVAVGPLERFIYEADPALERAQLLHTSGLHEPAAGLGLLTSDVLTDNPWLTAFEVMDVLPMREQRVKQRLIELEAGIVEVKTRGKACEPDALQRRWRGEGDRPLCVFVLRMGTAIKALITRRV